MNNLTSYLLTCLAEESSEVIKEVCKIQRFGVNETVDINLQYDNKASLISELRDLFTIIQMLSKEGFISLNEVLDDKQAIKNKENKVLYYFKAKHSGENSKQ